MLKLQNLTFEIEGKGKIIDDISFEMPSGKFLVITGPNGGGKSTLARLIMGIERPTSGRIIFNDVDITEKSISERAKMGIGFGFQQPPRFKGMTVRRLLSLAEGKELTEDRCCNYLTQVGLCSKDYLNREADFSLSGGEMKRIEIATLMARELKLAIYDEPEAGIDLWSFKTLVESFKTMSKSRHESVMIISHQERIMQIADDVLMLANGRIRAYGTREEILPTLMGELENCELSPEGSDNKWIS